MHCWTSGSLASILLPRVVLKDAKFKIPPVPDLILSALYSCSILSQRHPELLNREILASNPKNLDFISTSSIKHKGTFLDDVHSHIYCRGPRSRTPSRKLSVNQSFMSSSLQEVWDAAASSAFEPAVSKDYQFFVGFTLLLIGTFRASTIMRVQTD